MRASSSLILALFFASASCQTVMQRLSDDPDFSEFVAVLVRGNLTGLLSAPGPYTIFAPTNAAFAAPSPPVLLSRFLLYHVLRGNVPVAGYLSDLGNGMSLLAENGERVTAEVFKSAGTLDVLLNNNSRITSADNPASNGLYHAISGMLLPGYSNALTLVQRLALIPQFSTLVRLITSAGLADALGSASPLTLFAPSNAAFDAMSADAMEGLAGNAAALSKLLLYHVVSGVARSGSLRNGHSIATLNGASISVFINGNTVKLNGNFAATVLTADHAASNGVFHAIDAVLLPPAPPCGGGPLSFFAESPNTDCSAGWIDGGYRASPGDCAKFCFSSGCGGFRYGLKVWASDGKNCWLKAFAFQTAVPRPVNSTTFGCTYSDPPWDSWFTRELCATNSTDSTMSPFSSPTPSAESGTSSASVSASVTLPASSSSASSTVSAGGATSASASAASDASPMVTQTTTASSTPTRTPSRTASASRSRMHQGGSPSGAPSSGLSTRTPSRTPWVAGSTGEQDTSVSVSSPTINVAITFGGVAGLVLLAVLCIRCAQGVAAASAATEVWKRSDMEEKGESAEEVVEADATHANTQQNPLRAAEASSLRLRWTETL